MIVESIVRLPRMTADAIRIERELEDRDILLFAADEPTTANATAILTRRVKQGVAEWYVRDLIEKRMLDFGSSPTRANTNPRSRSISTTSRHRTRPAGLIVLTLTGDRIAAITRFLDHNRSRPRMHRRLAAGASCGAIVAGRESRPAALRDREASRAGRTYPPLRCGPG